MKAWKTYWEYGLVSFLYLLIFVPMNLAGAQNVEMLYAFQIDEVPQYNELVGTMTHGLTFLETLKNFLTIKSFYYYGWPEYFFAQLAIRGLKPILWLFGNLNPTLFQVFVFRQLSVFYTVLSCLIAVYAASPERFSSWKSKAIFLLMLMVPGVFLNASWIHPDALVMLFVCLTLLCFRKDALSFGRWYTLAAFFSGWAIGTKMLGIYFAVTVCAYSLYGFQTKTAPLKRILVANLRFLFVTIIGFLLSAPFLLYTHNRLAWAETIRYRGAASSKFVLGLTNPEEWIQQIVSPHFHPPFLSLALLAWAVAICWERKNRLWVLLVASWAGPYTFQLLLGQQWKGYWYLVPVFTLLLSLLTLPLPGAEAWSKRMRLAEQGIFACACVLLMLSYSKDDYRHFYTLSNRESLSPSVSFFSTHLKGAIVSALAKNNGKSLKIFRDPYIYLPASNGVEVNMKWGPVSYSDIKPGRFDLVILQSDLIPKLSNISECVKLNNSQETCEIVLPLYQDLARREVKGYKIIAEGGYGLVLAPVGSSKI